MDNYHQLSSQHPLLRYKYRSTILLLASLFPQYLCAQSTEGGELINFTSWLELLTGYLPLLVVPLLLLVIKNNSYRARFIWNKIIGSPFEVRDKQLKKIIQNQLDLEHLRSTAKFNFKNIYHARAIIRWCDDLKIGLDDIAGLSNSIIYDEHSDPKIKIKAKHGLIDKIMCIGMISVASTFFVLGIVAPPLSGMFGGYLYKMTESGDYLWVREQNNVRKLSFGGEPNKPVRKQDCESGSPTDYSMNLVEFSFSCLVLESGKDGAIILGDTKSEAIWASAFLIPLGFLMLWYHILQFKKIGRIVKISLSHDRIFGAHEECELNNQTFERSS